MILRRGRAYACKPPTLNFNFCCFEVFLLYIGVIYTLCYYVWDNLTRVLELTPSLLLYKTPRLTFKWTCFSSSCILLHPVHKSCNTRAICWLTASIILIRLSFKTLYEKDQECPESPKERKWNLICVVPFYILKYWIVLYDIYCAETLQIIDKLIESQQFNSHIIIYWKKKEERKRYISLKWCTYLLQVNEPTQVLSFSCF